MNFREEQGWTSEDKSRDELVRIRAGMNWWGKEQEWIREEKCRDGLGRRARMKWWGKEQGWTREEKSRDELGRRSAVRNDKRRLLKTILFSDVKYCFSFFYSIMIFPPLLLFLLLQSSLGQEGKNKLTTASAGLQVQGVPINMTGARRF